MRSPEPFAGWVRLDQNHPLTMYCSKPKLGLHSLTDVFSVQEYRQIQGVELRVITQMFSSIKTSTQNLEDMGLPYHATLLAQKAYDCTEDTQCSNKYFAQIQYLPKSGLSSSYRNLNLSEFSLQQIMLLCINWPLASAASDTFYSDGNALCLCYPVQLPLTTCGL